MLNRLSVKRSLHKKNEKSQINEKYFRTDIFKTIIQYINSPEYYKKNFKTRF